MPKPFPFPPDPVIEFYKKDVDRTLLRENLRLSPQERVEQLVMMASWIEEAAAARARRSTSHHEVGASASGPGGSDASG